MSPFSPGAVPGQSGISSGAATQRNGAKISRQKSLMAVGKQIRETKPEQSKVSLTCTCAADTFLRSNESFAMLDVIEKLLILQDRDRKISKLKEELMHIPVERQQHESR